MKYRVVVTLIAAILSGCEFQPVKANPGTQEGSFVRVFAVLSEDDLLLGFDKSTIDRAMLNQLKARCLGVAEPVPEIAPLAGTILSALVGSGIKLGVNAIDARLKKAMEAYSTSYSSRYGGVFHQTTDTGKSAYCWRVIRGRYIDQRANGSTVSSAEVLDFDATIELKPVHSNIMEVRPLRLFLGRPAPQKKSVNNQYGIAVALKLSTRTAEGMEEIFDTIVLKAAVTFNDSAVTKYFVQQNDRCLNADLPMYCIKLNDTKYVDGVPLGTRTLVQLTASVAESGAPSSFLKFASALFSGAKDDISDALAEAAVAKIDPDDK